jgi:hypothetical protein
MTQEEIDQVAEHARQIFNVLVAQVTDPQHWDWHPIAIRAIEIAEEFAVVLEERMPAADVESKTLPDSPEPKIPGDWPIYPPGYAPTPPPDPSTSMPPAYLPEATPAMPGPPPPPTPPSPPR